jgi:hypothetical protein
MAKSHLFMLYSPCQFRLAWLNQKLAVVAVELLCHQFRHLSVGLAEFPASLHQFRHQCLLLCQVVAAVSVCRLLRLRHIQPKAQWRQLKG